jgi:hypothetical protein
MAELFLEGNVEKRVVSRQLSATRIKILPRAKHTLQQRLHLSAFR